MKKSILAKLASDISTEMFLAVNEIQSSIFVYGLFFRLEVLLSSYMACLV